MNLCRFYTDKGASTILISLAIIFLTGFLLSKITKLLKLPNVTAYILAGVIIGPYALDLIPHYVIDNMDFLSDLALGFIAFGVGKFFKKEVIKETGTKVILITISEAVLAGVLVMGVTYLFFSDLGFNFALLLGAIATATAPASTMMTIKEYKAKGEFVNTLLQVVALDDVVCLLLFSVATAVASSTNNGFNIASVLLPILYNFIFLIIGFLIGLILPMLMKKRSKNSKMIIVIASICIISGTASLLDISPLLSCMLLGSTYLNKTKDEEIFNSISQFEPPIMLAFFVMSGMNMNIAAFKVVGVVGIVYFIVRLIGKYLGTYISAKATNSSKEIKNYLGFALAPQAGVAIGLAFLANRILPSDVGETFLTVILCSSVLYELIGPILAKFALFKSKSIDLSDVKKQVEISESKDAIKDLKLAKK